MKDIDRYQGWTGTTAIYPEDSRFAYLGLGLTSEAGEVASLIKKSIRDGTELDKESLAKELGDVFWYLARIADEVGLDSSYILQKNVEKLMSRKSRGVIEGSGDDR